MFSKKQWAMIVGGISLVVFVTSNTFYDFIRYLVHELIHAGMQ